MSKTALRISFVALAFAVLADVASSYSDQRCGAERFGAIGAGVSLNADLEGPLQPLQDRRAPVVSGETPQSTLVRATYGDRRAANSEPLTTATAKAASSCWSSELDQVNDPVARVRMGADVVQKVIHIALTGGALALDQEIAQMHLEQERAERGLRAAQSDLAAIGEGPPPQVTPRICATWRQSRDPNAIMATMCQRLTMQNALHLANGLIEVMQCVRQTIK